MVEYINAKDVLPKTLILQIQQYVGGSIIYIPQKDNGKNHGALLPIVEMKLLKEIRKSIIRRRTVKQ